MDNRLSSNFKNTFTNIVNHPETNFLLTVFFTFLTSYISLVSIFDRNLFSPISSLSEFNISINANNVTLTTKEKNAELIINTIISLFILLICGLSLGRLGKYVYLPSLLGMLLTGILFANVSFLSNMLSINSIWKQRIREAAIVVVLIRCGIGIDSDTFKRSWFVCANLGAVTATVEVGALVIVTHFFYDFKIELAVFFGYLIAASSAAVIVPSMIKLNSKGCGTDKGIPSAILASVAMDNLYCIAALVIIKSSFFESNNIFNTLKILPVEIIAGCLLGVVSGVVLRVFPRYDAHLAHFTRALLLFTTANACFFGFRAINNSIAAPISVVILSIISSTRWKMDNHRMSCLEAKTFKIMWDLFFLPLLFVLIGLVFDFSVFSWTDVLSSIIILVIGLIARILSTFVVSLCTNLNIKEKIFLSLCFFSKATVQAVFLPEILAVDQSKSNLIKVSVVILIFFTSSIGQVIIDVLSKFCLNKRRVSGKNVLETHSNICLPMPKPNFHQIDRVVNYNNLKSDLKENKSVESQINYLHTDVLTNNESEKHYIMSDKDNHLRLKVLPINGNNSIKTIQTNLNESISSSSSDSAPPVPKTPLPTFDEINETAYEAFKKKKLNCAKNTDLKDLDSLGNYYQFPQPMEQNKNSTFNKTITIEKL